MASRPYSRRDFLKFSALGILACGFSPGRLQKMETPFAIGRVATPLIYVYEQPSFNSERIDSRTRDTLINLLEEVSGLNGPLYNPRWYRVDSGFIHSGHVQRIGFRPPNEPLPFVPSEGLYGEITVPYTRAFYRARGSAWQPLYRLYYESVHWIKGVVEYPDGMVWYRLFDPKNDSAYYVPAADVRPIAPEEYAPVARDVPRDEKRILISTQDQTLTAYEGDRVVLNTSISSGVPSLEPVPDDEPPTDTPFGSWRITLKMPSRHMGDGRLTSDHTAYELPGVPWAMAFHEDGYALHGSYWHDNFGRRMSHGCVNMRSQDALWLFRWSEPVYETADWYVQGLGTLIIIT